MKTPKTRTKERTADKYHHGDLRAALLKAVGELLGEVGLERLTLRACARRAGVSHGAPAHHFGSLTGLLTEFAADGFGRLCTAMDKASSTSRDPLRATGIGYIRFAIEAPQQFRLMWRNGVLDQGSPKLQAARAGAGQRLREALIAAYTVKHQRAPSAATLKARLSLAWCCVHGYACLRTEGVQTDGLTSVEAMLDALRPALVD
jgi:AcrR family transcriptional regulator